MQNKIVFRLTFVVLCCGIALASFVSNAKAQRAEKKKPRLINFGSSLRRDPAKKDQKPAKSANLSPDDEVIKVETTLVVTNFLVLDKKGRAINNLTKDDFVVTEDNQPQQIEAFTLGDNQTIGRSIVLILDYSGSLLPYIETSVEAAKTLVDKLTPDDRMAIVTDNVELLTDFTNDKKLLKDKLQALKKDALKGNVGQSNQYSALLAALQELFDDEDTRPIVIFQTDGDELGRLKGVKFPKLNVSERYFGIDDILTATDKKRATVYTIVPGVQFVGVAKSEFSERAKKDLEQRLAALDKAGMSTPRNSKQNFKNFAAMLAQTLHTQQLAVAGVAKYTGGLTDYIESPEQADAVYSRVLADINQRYVIGYYPTNNQRDGKRRKVAVTVRNHPEYTVWGRKTYIAPEQ